MFGKTRRIASKISDALLADFRIAFVRSKYLSPETGLLSFPFDFFSDEYIRGFVTGYISSMVAILFHDQRLSFKQRDDISFRVWEQVAGADAMIAVREIAKIGVENQSEFGDFFRAYDEAAYYVGARLGVKLADGVESPILEEARNMASALHNETILSPTAATQVHTSTSIGSALFILTLKKHVTQNYLQ